MKIVWVYRIEADVKSHITTWRETFRYLASQHAIHYIFTYKHEKRSFTDDIVFVSTPDVAYVKRLLFIARAFISFVRLSHRLKPDLVILDQWTFFFSIAYLVRRSPKFVLDNRSAEFYVNSNADTLGNRLLKAYTKLALRWNWHFHAGITYISEALKRQFEHELNMPLPKPYCVWPSGVDTELFDPTRYGERADDGTFRLFFHGSMTPNRGLTEVLEALQIVGDERVEWTLIGGGDSEYLRKFEQRASELGLGGRVHVLEYLDYREMPKQIAQADLCVMPYPRLKYWEGNVPIKILEYMAMAKPVLCTDLTVFREITQANAATIFVPDNDGQSLARGLQYAITNAAEMKRQGLAARRIVQENYTWQHISERLNDYLENL